MKETKLEHELAAQRRRPTALEIFRYIGPGLIVTVGFIDPGNWAANVAAGAQFGYSLLWVVTLSTFMLVLLQHNVAHLGIVTGLCLSEACAKHVRPAVSRTFLSSAIMAGISTAFAEILGAAIGLRILFHLPLEVGACLTAAFILAMLFTNKYRRIEKWIIGFVSLIGIAFFVELVLVKVGWTETATGLVWPQFPAGSIVIIMSVLGAVVMPHNLFLHSEIIQSRQWNLADDSVIKRQLRFEFADTLFSMVVGWAINGAMIIVAGATFHAHKLEVTQLEQAESLLRPIAGGLAATVFAVALLLAGVASSVTAGMAGGSIFAGMFHEAYDVRDKHTRRGILLTVLVAVGLVFLVRDPFKGLILSQMLLSVQLPWTIFMQLRLTSSKKVMGKYANGYWGGAVLWTVAAIVAALNVFLLWQFIAGM